MNLWLFLVICLGCSTLGGSCLVIDSRVRDDSTHLLLVHQSKYVAEGCVCFITTGKGGLRIEGEGRGIEGESVLYGASSNGDCAQIG